MADSPSDSSTTSTQLYDSQHTTNSSMGNSSMIPSLPSIPSLPPLDLEPIIDASPSTHDMSIPSDGTNHIPSDLSLRQFVWGHIHSCGSYTSQFIFKNNHLPLLLNILGHLFTAKQLCRTTAVTKYTNLRSSSSQVVASDLFQNLGVLHLALGALSALALKERRLSTERMALWVLAVVAWGRSLLQTRAYISSPGLYTINALQEWGILNGVLTIISTIALRNTIQRTGRLF
ncbi:hypothetical protein BC941DRAFT_445375 [Chlamydoabsidia padenii]|nr:hypothetical protein BC941DRAFT_445375 [Chlamydoabsidia padenii]